MAENKASNTGFSGNEKNQKSSQGMPGPNHAGPMSMLNVDKPKNAKQSIKRLVGYMKPYRLLIAIVCLFSIGATVFDIISPIVLGKATTSLFESATQGLPVDFDYLYDILVCLAALYIVSALCMYGEQFIMAKVSQTIVFDLRQSVEEKLNCLPLSFYDKNSNGDILSRVVNDVDLISSTLQDSITETITAAVTLIGVLVMMVAISPVMTLIAIATIPLSLFVTVGITKHSQKHFFAEQNSLGELDAHIEELYSAHTVVKAFSREEDSIEEFDRINEKYYKHAQMGHFIGGAVRPAMGFIGDLGYVAVCVVGALYATQGTITVGNIQAFIQYMRSFTRPITQLASIINILQQTLAGAERVFAILDAEEMSDEPECAQTIEHADGHIEFDHVRFGYVPGVTVIKDLCLDVAPGQKIAIVGPTGAGKSTIVNLLMRFYEIDEGDIRLDGVPITAMTRHGLRKHFGMVLQDTWLFSGSIRDNIAYGNTEATEEEIVEAAKAAYADHFIRTLPNGYDTLINEEGTNISAGQKQLLTIARALLAKPEVLVLDEATSSIDTRTERLVQQAMDELSKHCTSFIIAHRLSTIRNADCVLVLRDGDIVEQGTHDELLALDGFYASLYNSQFASCIDEVEEN